MNLAYLDPGSGSMLAAALVAGFAGAAVAVRVWWRRLMNKFFRRPVGATAAASAGAAGTTASASERASEAEPAEETTRTGAGETGIGATPSHTSADSDRNR